MRVLIIGCGYVGGALGAELARRGHEVWGVRRAGEGMAELTALGIRGLAADIALAEDCARLRGEWDWVVNSVSSTRGGAEAYRRVYLQGTGNLLAAWRGAFPGRYLHLSSTSVYGQTDGSVVTEESLAEPATETGRILVETEARLRAAAREGLPVILLRAAGIYGPGRGYWLQQFLRGEARLAGDGGRLINMVHRDDVTGAIRAALEAGRPGDLYNVVDDAPVTQRELFAWLAGTLGRPMPPAVAEDPRLPRKRGQTCKRVSNARLKERLGWRPLYPTYREGFRAEIARLRTADEGAGRPDSRTSTGSAKDSQ